MRPGRIRVPLAILALAIGAGPLAPVDARDGGLLGFPSEDGARRVPRPPTDPARERRDAPARDATSPPAGARGDEPSPAEPNPAGDPTDGEAPPRPAPEAERPAPPLTIVLPDAGEYRAPAILRLAGRLAGLDVRVAARSINDVPVRITPRAARRPVSLAGMKILLAAHSLYLHEWVRADEPSWLVVSDRADWSPPLAEYRYTLRVEPGEWGQVWPRIEAAVAKRNERLGPTERRLVALPSRRAGKIFLWSPSKRWLDALLEPEGDRAADDGDDDGERVYSHRARFLLADELADEIAERLGAGERRRLHLRPSPWGNLLFARTADRLLADRFLLLAAELDRKVASD